jgi:lysophospholipase L1-like esterase
MRYPDRQQKKRKVAFKIRFSRNSVREGRPLLTRIRAPRRQQGQLLYWSLEGKGIKRNDFNDGRTNGLVILNASGRATVRHYIRVDNRQEKNEQARFTLYADQQRRQRHRIAKGSFEILDKNQKSPDPSPPKPGYSIAFSRPSVQEGKSIRSNIKAPRQLSGQRLFWRIDGNDITASDFANGRLRGDFKLNRKGLATIRFPIAADRRLEGTESARLRIFSDRRRTDILAASRFRILDTSKPSPIAAPVPAPTPLPTPLPTPAPVPPSQDPRPPAADKPPQISRLKIMPMGDSITVGFGSEDQAGYRGPLRDTLTGKPYSVEFVGKFGSNLRHWGRTGALISEDRDPITGETYVTLRQNSEIRFRNTLAPDIDEAISSTYFSKEPSTKNVLLLTIGSNDFSSQVVSRKYGAVSSGDLNNDAIGEQQDKLGETIIQRLRSFLTRVNNAARRTGVSLEVLLGTIPTQLESPRNPDRPASSITRSEIGQYNTLIKQTLNGSSAFSNLEIAVVDQFSAVGINLLDGLHPTAAGYNAMASAWLKGIEANVLA